MLLGAQGAQERGNLWAERQRLRTPSTHFVVLVEFSMGPQQTATVSASPCITSLCSPSAVHPKVQRRILILGVQQHREQAVPVIGSAALEEALTGESACHQLVTACVQLSSSKVSDDLT